MVKKHANGLADKLKLPPELGTIHDTFHISLPKRYVSDSFQRNDVKNTTNLSKNFMSIPEILNPEI